MPYLKQSTAKVISLGPFVSPSDGVTLVTSLVSALDHASTGIMLSKNGGAFAVRHATVTASTYDAYGNYLVTLDTTDTNTLGILRVQFCAAASCAPVWIDYEVVPANVYDSMIAGSDYLDVSTVQFAGQTITCGAGVTIRADVGAAAAPGAANGMLIGGSNAATTFSGLTTGALSCTTITASGAVAFQSTFAVTTSTSLGAISGTTLTLSGAVAFQSTFAVTTSTSLGALSCTTLTASGAVALQSTLAITGTTTLTGAVTASNASNNIVGCALTSTGVTAVVTGVLTTQMTEAYAADGVAPTLAQMLFMSWSLLSERSVSGTTVTAKKLDGSTTSMTFTLNSATQPTSQTRAT